MSKPVILIECEPIDDAWVVYTDAVFDFARPGIEAFNGSAGPMYKQTLSQCLNDALELRREAYRGKEIVVVDKRYSQTAQEILLNSMDREDYMIIKNDIDAITAIMRYS